LGSGFDAWLDEEGIRADVDAGATKAALVKQITARMKQRKLTKTRLAQAAGITRAQLDRVLDEDYVGVTLRMLVRVAAALGARVTVTLE
jgi:predicted XRE-type DNA-binding protein